MKSLFKTLLLAMVLMMGATNAQAWWNDSYGSGYYNDNGWDNGSFWGDSRGYGRGSGSGEGSFSFSVSARGSADTEWDSDYYGGGYGGSYYGGQPYYVQVPHATVPEAGE